MSEDIVHLKIFSTNKKIFLQSTRPHPVGGRATGNRSSTEIHKIPYALPKLLIRLTEYLKKKFKKKVEL